MDSHKDAARLQLLDHYFEAVVICDPFTELKATIPHDQLDELTTVFMTWGDDGVRAFVHAAVGYSEKGSLLTRNYLEAKEYIHARRRSDDSDSADRKISGLPKGASEDPH